MSWDIDQINHRRKESFGKIDYHSVDGPEQRYGLLLAVFDQFSLLILFLQYDRTPRLLFAQWITFSFVLKRVSMKIIKHEAGESR